MNEAWSSARVYPPLVNFGGYPYKLWWVCQKGALSISVKLTNGTVELLKTSIAPNAIDEAKTTSGALSEARCS